MVRAGKVVVTAAALIAATVVPAEAQNSPPQRQRVPDRVAPTPVQTPQRTETVTTRPRPELDPLGVRVGSFVAFPSLEFAPEFDDNIFKTKDGKQSDIILNTTPALMVQSDWNQHFARAYVDVNSGKATREFSIEETALQTNLEAADEVARQLKLRDLAGLIVIDFIDMEERRNNRKVENRLKDALRHDRARIQVGRISHFGLLEMSRQRLRTGVTEGSTTQCPHCQGTGIVRSTESVALAVLRALEDHLVRDSRAPLTAIATAEVALYILNNKRSFITEMEHRYAVSIAVQASDRMHGANFAIEKSAPPVAPLRTVPRSTAVSMAWAFDSDEGEDGAAVNEINSTIRSASSGADGRMRYALEDNSLWVQTEGRVGFPRAGDAIRIRRGPLGSFIANIAGRPAVRVIRER